MKKTVKLISILLALIMLISCVPFTIFALESANASEVTILTQADAGTPAAFAELIKADPTGNFELASDLDWGGVGAAGIIDVDFSGVIDGKGYTIKNFKLTNGSMFKTYNYGTIKNIGFDFTLVNTTDTNCGIVYENRGILENIYLDVNATGTAKAGTLTAINRGFYIRNVIVNLTSTTGTSNADIGTLAAAHRPDTYTGSGRQDTYENCYVIHNGVTSATTRPNCTSDPYVATTTTFKTYATLADMLAEVTELSASAGWSEYWRISGNTLKFSAESDFQMNFGAEARIDSRKGIRFTANITKEQFDEWTAEYTVEAGMIIVPYDYISKYGALTAENIFGENAVYSFDDSKVKIINLVTKSSDLKLSADGKNVVVKGSIVDIKESNIDRPFTARAYVKLTKNGSSTYVMADYNKNNIDNNTRSILYIATAAYNYHTNTAGGVYSDEVVSWLEDVISKGNTSTEITNLAVYKTYDFSTMKDVHSTSGNTPLAWRGNTESDRANIYAGYELVNLYKEITGKTLSVTYINNISELDPAKSYIILGTELAEQAGLDHSGITADNGHKLVKNNGNIYLYGKNGYGTVNAVYELLRQAYGVEFFSDTKYTVEDASYSIDEITDATFNPSVDYNWAMDGALFIGEDKAINYTYQFRMGFVNYWQIQSGNIHGFETVFPKDTYSQCYASNGILDLNAAGEINTENAMVVAVADWIYNKAMTRDSYGRLPNMTLYAFGPQDERKWSDSSTSKTNLNTYGSNSGEYILFMNAVAERLDTAYDDLREIDVLMMAYNEVLDAPTKNLDQLSFYSGSKVSLKVMFAPIEMNMNDSPTSTVKDNYSGKPTEYFAEYAKWQSLAGEDNVYVWRYSAIFSNYFMPLNAIEHIQANYQAFIGDDNYIKHFVDQGASGSGDQSVQTNFAALLVYLKGQLGKNANADVDALIDKFCKAYYGEEAGTYMKQLILAEREHLNDVKSTMANTLLNLGYKDISGCHYQADNSVIYNAEYWGAGCSADNGIMLKEWYGHITSALSATNNAEEQNNIRVEAIAIRYMSLRVYNVGVYDGDTLESVYADAKILGITHLSEGLLIP